MTLYKLFGNNINKRMPIWESIDGAGSISLLKGRGKQFLILGEIHCDRLSDKPSLCLSQDNPVSPARLLADLARYTPSFLDIYTEYSEFEYWAPGGHLSGFLGEIARGPSDLYLGPGVVGTSRRGLPCMDFQWIHRAAAREPKDAWRMGVCLTSRWHYTDIRELEQSELDKIWGDEEDSTRLYLGSGREGVNLKAPNFLKRFQDRKSATLEFLVWEGFAGGTGGGDAYTEFKGHSAYQKKLYAKVGPKLFLEWTKKHLPDNSLGSLIRFETIYSAIRNYFDLDDPTYAKEAAPPELIVAGKVRPTPLCFALWQLAHDTGINVDNIGPDTITGTITLKSFLDLIVMYALLQNDHMIKVLGALAKAADDWKKPMGKQKDNYDRLWDLMFTKSLIGGSPRLKKALERTTEKDAILTWARNRYDALISAWVSKGRGGRDKGTPC